MCVCAPLCGCEMPGECTIKVVPFAFRICRLLCFIFGALLNFGQEASNSFAGAAAVFYRSSRAHTNTHSSTYERQVCVVLGVFVLFLLFFSLQS